MGQISSKAALDTMRWWAHASQKRIATQKKAGGAVFLPCSCLLSAKRKNSIWKERFEKTNEAFFSPRLQRTLQPLNQLVESYGLQQLKRAVKDHI